MNTRAIRLSHLKNLCLLAKADNRVKPEEVSYIRQVLVREELTEEDLALCLNHPDEIEFCAPDTYSESVEFFHDLIHVMLSDRDIDDRELQLCEQCAAAMNIPVVSRQQIIKDMIALITKEMEEEGIAVTHNGE